MQPRPLAEILTAEQDPTPDPRCGAPGPDSRDTCQRPADHKLTATAARESHADRIDTGPDKGSWVIWADPGSWVTPLDTN